LEQKEIETLKMLPGFELKIKDLKESKKCIEEEVQYLRQSRLDLAKEREELLGELHGF
jgi:FtsZ-binding cell division protein ZapB